MGHQKAKKVLQRSTFFAFCCIRYVTLNPAKSQDFAKRAHCDSEQQFPSAHAGVQSLLFSIEARRLSSYRVPVYFPIDPLHLHMVIEFTRLAVHSPALQGIHFLGQPSPACVSADFGRNGTSPTVQGHKSGIRFLQERAKSDAYLLRSAITVQMQNHGLSISYRVACFHIHRRRRIDKRIVLDRHSPPLGESGQKLR